MQSRSVAVLKGLALAAPAFLMLTAAPSDTVPVPVGLLPIVWPKDNPYTPEKAELGRVLFFDKRLSDDGTVACASCHVPQHAFSEPSSVSTGIHGAQTTRNSPTIVNRAFSMAQFWDGRAPTLEEQAKGPLNSPQEMGTRENCVKTLNGIAGYRLLFLKAFGSEEITFDRAASAIATFERTLLSGNSPYDRFTAGDKKALSPAQVRGMKIFFNKAKCDKCHEGLNFTSNSYHNLGVGMDKPSPDLGRFEFTKDPRDMGAFKTPTLREIASTAPYMHDGSIRTLDEVVEFYDKGGNWNKNLDPDMKRLSLTRDQKSDLVAFLQSLSGEGWQQVRAPDSFPQ